jgi:hypothetical protein
LVFSDNFNHFYKYGVYANGTNVVLKKNEEQMKECGFGESNQARSQNCFFVIYIAYSVGVRR